MRWPGLGHFPICNKLHEALQFLNRRVREYANDPLFACGRDLWGSHDVGDYKVAQGEPILPTIFPSIAKLERISVQGRCGENGASTPQNFRRSGCHGDQRVWRGPFLRVQVRRYRPQPQKQMRDSRAKGRA